MGCPPAEAPHSSAEPPKLAFGPSPLCMMIAIASAKSQHLEPPGNTACSLLVYDNGADTEHLAKSDFASFVLS